MVDSADLSTNYTRVISEVKAPLLFAYGGLQTLNGSIIVLLLLSI